jgi:hypothetical protein
MTKHERRRGDRGWEFTIKIWMERVKQDTLGITRVYWSRDYARYVGDTSTLKEKLDQKVEPARGECLWRHLRGIDLSRRNALNLTVHSCAPPAEHESVSWEVTKLPPSRFFRALSKIAKGSADSKKTQRRLFAN